jgi:hypothetical protein
VITLSDVEAARRRLIPDGSSTDLPVPSTASSPAARSESADIKRNRWSGSKRRSPEARAKFGFEPAFESARGNRADARPAPPPISRRLRRQTYEQQRFGFALHPSEEETLTYYRSNQDRFKRNGVLPPYDDVRADVLAAVIANKRSELTRDWIAGLRRRANIVVLPSR